MKKRILVVGEFSGISSGYGTIQKELMRRFYATNKYEVAELASGIGPEDPNLKMVPWRVFPVVPHRGNEEALKIFGQDPLNPLGKYLWESVCCQYKPDIIVIYSDPWFHLPWIVTSPLRKFYQIAYQSPVDGFPQNSDWIDWTDKCDKIFTYTNWGAKVLQQHMTSRHDIEAAHLCADSSIFVKHNKSIIRQKFNVLDDAIIFGMCARNQPRKDYDTLFTVFKEYLKRSSLDIANRSYLYIHSSFPDQSWSFDEMLHEHGLSGKVLFTYKCANCQQFYPSFFVDARSLCRKCGSPALGMTAPHNGITSQQLCEIYNLWDLSVHLAFCGGFELPILEAIFCGVPAIYTDYSGPEDFKETVGAIPIQVSGHKREHETGRYWGITDQNDAIEKMLEFSLLPSNMKQSLGDRMRCKAIEYYSWDTTANLWMQYFDRSSVLNQNRWSSNAIILDPEPTIDFKGMSASEVVRWCIYNIAKDPYILETRFYTKMIYDLNNGFTQNGVQRLPFGPQNIIDWCVGRRKAINFWENERLKYV